MEGNMLSSGRVWKGKYHAMWDHFVGGKFIQLLNGLGDYNPFEWNLRGEMTNEIGGRKSAKSLSKVNFMAKTVKGAAWLTKICF